MAAILTLAPAEEVKIPAAQIIAAVAAVHGFPIAELKGQRRSPGIIGARWHAIALLIKARPDLSFCVIGALMNRDHSTVIYAKRHWPAIANNYRQQTARVFELVGIE